MRFDHHTVDESHDVKDLQTLKTPRSGVMCLGVSGIRSMVTVAKPPKKDAKPQIVRQPCRIRRKCCPETETRPVLLLLEIEIITGILFLLILRNWPINAPMNAPDTKVVSCTAIAPPAA